MLRRLYCMLRRLYWFSEELEATLAPAEAEVGAVAKAEQNRTVNFVAFYSQNNSVSVIDHLKPQPLL